MVRYSSAVLLLGALVAPSLVASDNPPAPGFNAAASDPEAIEIADQVMESMGGREAWDRTRYVSWRFFAPPPDGRTHVWDKHSGDLRFQHGDRLVLMNIHTREGEVWENGEKIEEPEALADALERGYEAWINDSYWLCMPYKLKDSGVTLKYQGEGETQEGRPAHVLQLTFEDVGVTPQNKYHVWVDKERMLVTQWAYYPEAADEEPRFTLPWKGWEKHGEILLSGDRGQMQLTEISVFDELPESVFTSPDPVDLEAYK